MIGVIDAELAGHHVIEVLTSRKNPQHARCRIPHWGLHATACEWLGNQAEFDVAMLQEAIPPTNLGDSFASVLLQSRFPVQKSAWGNHTSIRSHEFSPFQVANPTWAASSMDATLVVFGGEGMPALVNVHSNAQPIERFPRTATFTRGHYVFR